MSNQMLKPKNNQEISENLYKVHIIVNEINRILYC